MTRNEIALISRSSIYSPNNVNSDRQILEMTGQQLARKGFKVSLINEDEGLDKVSPDASIIVEMCRKPASVEVLKRWEDEGRLVVNSGYGIENCFRENMTLLFERNKIPSPESLIVATDYKDIKKKLDDHGFDVCWIKRADGHTIHKEDVSYVRHSREAREILAEYSMRGISKAVINKHLRGDLVKFYGISATPFFYAFYPFEVGHSKFGQEAINGSRHGYDFDKEELHAVCQKCADVTSIDVYGGDAIIAPDGSISIIDFNDWPSFAPCRAEASEAIAEMIINKFENGSK